MAATKKAMQARDERAALVRQIETEQGALAAVTKVPAAVVQGSHQLAVRWKEALESLQRSPTLLSRPRPSVRRASLLELRERLAVLKALLIEGRIEEDRKCLK